MIWIIFWIVVGTMWSWYALLEYYLINKRGMSTGFEVLNILLNTLFLPFGLFFGIFIYLVVRKSEGDETVDFDFTIAKLITNYEVIGLDDKKD